jgi:hypothetical protein
VGNPGIDFGKNQQANVCVASIIGDETRLAGAADIYSLNVPQKACSPSQENYKRYKTLMRYDASGREVLYVVDKETAGKFTGFYVEQKMVDVADVQKQMDASNEQLFEQESTSQETAASTNEMTAALVGDKMAENQNKAAAGSYAGQASASLEKRQKKGKVIKTLGTVGKVYYAFSHKSGDVRERGLERVDALQGAGYLLTNSDPQDIQTDGIQAILNTSCVASGGCSQDAPQSAQAPAPAPPPVINNNGGGYYNYDPPRIPGSLSNCLSDCMGQINNGPKCQQYCGIK